MTGVFSTAPSAESTPLPTVEVLGVSVTNATKAEAAAMMDGWIRARDGRSRGVFIVNAHTLNLAWEDPTYRAILNDGDVVFGDGSGVRLAARMRGVRMRDNLVGTDLLPFFFREMAPRRYRYFLLGATTDTVARAAARVAADFPGIQIAGTSHGYVHGPEGRGVVRTINDARPDLLLVAMGNPVQERWIHDHRADLRVPVSVGVGGLFDHWGGNLSRAPLWVRRLGIEWVQILLQQPNKWRRYLLGNPRFVVRALRGAGERGTR
jgi:N-acetylglucosaminyldiphosphoundecaprenol N-acetyl-beta-D-mannosaminyltransferase